MNENLELLKGGGGLHGASTVVVQQAESGHSKKERKRF
jgi:hypothetical protein